MTGGLLNFDDRLQHSPLSTMWTAFLLASLGSQVSIRLELPAQRVYAKIHPVGLIVASILRPYTPQVTAPSRYSLVRRAVNSIHREAMKGSEVAGLM